MKEYLELELELEIELQSAQEMTSGQEQRPVQWMGLEETRRKD